MKKLLALGALLALPSFALVGPRAATIDDLVFEGGRVVDGTGAPWFVADVAVRDGKIAAIGSLGKRPAKRRIDARGLVVAPGFIDLLGQSEYNVLVDGRAAVFDPQTVRDVATFEAPNRYSEGFRFVAVNGVLVVDGGKLTGKTPGRAVRGPGWKRPSASGFVPAASITRSVF